MRGDVTVQAECLLPQRLIQRATAGGARFSGVRLEGDSRLIFDCDAASARRLLALCERFGIPARITGRRGLSALSAFLRGRATLLLGIALAAALCAAGLGRVWRIDIAFTGENAALGDAPALARSLDELGVRPGISNRQDTSQLAQRLQAGGDYSYVGVRMQGVRLLVEAAPELSPPAVYDVDSPRDLVAARDGIVVRAVARSGSLCVKPGDTVRRGQVLIRGEELDRDDATRPIAALGEVVLRAWYEGEARLPVSETVTEYTGRAATGSRLRALSWSLPIAGGVQFASQRVRTEYLPVGGLFVPVEIVRTTCRETRTVRTRPQAAALKARAAALAMADAALNLLQNGPETYEALRSWVDYTNTGAALRAHAVFEIRADAAVTREALQGG